MTENSIDSTAAYWALKQQSGDMTGAEKNALADWLNESPKHRTAFEKTQSILNMTDRVSDQADEDFLEVEFSAAMEVAPPVPRRQTFSMIAASAAFIAAACVLWVMSNSSEMTQIATVKGEQSEFNLSDGSTAVLNTQSQIAVNVSRSRRHVAIDRGEVYFDVAEDPARPFVVSANDVEIVVVGTVFNVRVFSELTAVSVVSGAVTVKVQRPENAASGSGGERTISLSAGDQLLYWPERGGIELQEINAQNIGSWISGQAIYDDQPLEYVVADLNRYFHKRLELGEPALSSIPVSGTFDLTDSGAAIEGLAVALSLQRVQTATGAVRLVSQNQSTSKPQE